jgi:hypothetical protein
MSAIELSTSSFSWGEHFIYGFRILIFESLPILTAIVGTIGFYCVYTRMRILKIKSPPVITYGILFSILTGVLLILLWDFGTAFSFIVSILGFIEGMYALYLAPFLTTALVFILYPKRKVSTFHLTAFIASVVYTGMMLAIFIGWLSVRLFVKPVVVN